MKLKIKPHKNIDKHNKMIHKQRHSVNPFGCQLREKDEDKPIQLDHRYCLPLLRACFLQLIPSIPVDLLLESISLFRYSKFVL